MAGKGLDAKIEIDFVDAFVLSFVYLANPSSPLLLNEEIFEKRFPVNKTLGREFSLDKAIRAQVA